MTTKKKQSVKKATSFERWSSSSQFFRYSELLKKEKGLKDTLKNNDSTKVLFQDEKERDDFVRELLIDLKFKSLFSLHLLIEKGDREAILFAVRELIPKDHIATEFENIDEKTLLSLESFLKK